jgi:hypothetical protein
MLGTLREDEERNPVAKQTPVEKLAVEKIVAAMEQARRPTAFSCDGRIDADVGLEVEGLGPVKLPVRPAMSRKLAEVATLIGSRASPTLGPYGKRTETIQDTSVGDTWEIAADAVRLSDSFRLAIEVAVAEAATALRLDHDRLEVELYKLLIYQKGGFFLTHHDNEKRRDMVATMIVVLPSKFGGGELIVEHGGQRKQYRFDLARSQSMAQYAAFFADCNYEVKRVTSGVRVCLAFNLHLKARRNRQSETASHRPPNLLRTVEDLLRTPKPCGRS